MGYMALTMVSISTTICMQTKTTMKNLLLEELQVIKVQEELQQRVGRSLRLPSLSLEPSDLQYMQQCFMHNLQRVESPICQLKVVQWLKKLVIFFIYFIIAHS